MSENQLAVSADLTGNKATNNRSQPGLAEPQPRLWPGVVIIGLQWLLVQLAARYFPETMIQLLWGPVIGTAAFLTWWVLASRLPWTDRFLVLLECAVLGAVAFFVRDSSFTGMGLAAFFFKAIPVVTTTWILWLVATPWLRWPIRRAGLLVVFFVGWGYFTLLRFDGTDGSISAVMPYRWTGTGEEKLTKYLKENSTRPAVAVDPALSLKLQPGDWPGFRGSNRDGRLPGVRIATDWEKNPPRQLWRHPVGPGWSSFAVIGTRLYTQEQRGPEEAVVCYDAPSGAEIWIHRDSGRFTEAVAGPGPRATPTFHDGNIYALGAAGRLNCLEAATGKMVWSCDIGKDADAKIPTWGFASSPLVVQGVVTVYAGGPDNKSVRGYDAGSGELKWTARAGRSSYCSLQPATLGGMEQLVLATEQGLTAFDPATGSILWEHHWLLEGGMARITQPALVEGDGFLLGTGFYKGTRRVSVQRQDNGWTAKEKWTTRAISPYFNDLVIHKSHLYGFDGNFFTCVNLENGKSTWRERGYGNGQVLLLVDQELLLVLTETGEAVLVEAKPEGHKELGRFQALEGKTWNHPVIAHGMLFVRNGAEAACYQMKE